MKISKVRIKNFRSIKDSGEISFNGGLFVLAGQNESGKSSILDALNSFGINKSNKDDLNFELENAGDLIQEIEVTYTDLDNDFYDIIENELSEYVYNLNISIVNLEKKSVFKEDPFPQIRSFKIKKTFDFTSDNNSIITRLDKSSFAILLQSFHTYSLESNENKTEKKSLLINNDENQKAIAEIFSRNTMKVLYFNDFQILLPDKILLNELKSSEKEGIKAVMNIEKLLKSDFESIANKSTPQKNSTIEKESLQISADFQMDWQQKIYSNNKVNIRIFIENDNTGSPEISFYVETKEGEYLAPRKRSKGMIWFLSLWLELKAHENEKNLLLLFDEPGQNLHIKANRDMLLVFHKLIEKGHQIIYTTHSPYLIETEKLQNIGLVINHEKEGTTIEGLTSSKINSENRKDALQPISDAMGMEHLKDFNLFKRRNVLLEGISDFWYFKAMSIILKINSEYTFIPGVGTMINKINYLISFCIGNGLEWLLIMDDGGIPKTLIKELKSELFFNDDFLVQNKIKLIDEAEIENMFHFDDLLLVDPTLKGSKQKSSIDIIGKGRKNLFSKMFLEKVSNGEIKKEDLHPETIAKFQNVFNWIEEKFNIS